MGAVKKDEAERGRLPPWRLFERAATTSVAALLALLLVANLPFYAGASLNEHTTWRMEHGRITFERRARVRQESFWVAANTEGLRWSFDAREYGDEHWELTVPLWFPLLLASLACLWSWRPSGRATS